MVLEPFTVDRSPLPKRTVFAFFTETSGRITENTFIEEKFFMFLRDKITVNGKYDHHRLFTKKMLFRSHRLDSCDFLRTTVN